MADPNPTVDELFKAKAVTNEQVSTLLDAVLEPCPFRLAHRHRIQQR
ncbi:hypothetical protein LNAOJCKE_5727 [Methylorubrum aminovorans]|uniref:Uncharacterized protein n=1 Tax=Methylorubrum aminovorans TaxID=269069 RepID=A0ABQ4UP90_9HYPH|nr:hypothetical protein LNAOJCKE_5727 [Methylorubrum aminovorans]